jgi:hypothetical protein
MLATFKGDWDPLNTLELPEWWLNRSAFEALLL